MAVMKVGAAGIETMSGALKRPKKQDGHNHGNYLVATHRTAATTNPNCQRVYSFDADRYKRSTPVTTEELGSCERPQQDGSGQDCVQRAEGSAGWQKDHEELPLVSRARCLG